MNFIKINLADEHNVGCPNLGGTENSVGKRQRHIRSFSHMVFDQKQTDRLLICVDSASKDLIHDLHQYSAKVKTMLMMCQYNETYLVGHAQRTDLSSKAPRIKSLSAYCRPCAKMCCMSTTNLSMRNSRKVIRSTKSWRSRKMPCH